MRQIVQNVLDDYAISPRTVGARLTFRKKRLVFTTTDVSNSFGYPTPLVSDTCVYDTGIAQVCVFSNTLYTLVVPDVVNWGFPSWTDTGIVLKVNSRPGIEGGYVWYQKANGAIYYRSLANWSTEVLANSTLGAYTVAIAPLGTTAYVQYFDGIWLSLAYIYGEQYPDTWGGRIYGNLTTSNYIDAVTLDGKDYIYTMDRSDGRILELVKAGTMWGGTSYVLPLDELDDGSGFTLNAASVIDNKVYLTGRLVRVSDGTRISMDIFSVGPRNFSIGREMFITKESRGAKLFLIGDKVVYPGADTIEIAPATILVGYDNASLKTTTSEVSNISYAEAQNQGGSLNVELAREQTGIENGNDVDFEISYGGHYAKIGTLNVDAITAKDDEQGKSLEVSCIASGIKSASDWTPDASLWLPSQAKLSCNPSDLEQVIRIRGSFHANNPGDPLYLEDVNSPGVLYSVARSSRGGMAKARFLYPSGTFTPSYGVVINYYQESYNEASIRNGIAQKEVTPDKIGDNGILAIWSQTEYNGNPGIGIYVWTNSVLSLVGAAPLSIPADTWHWLKLYFQDGIIRASYRLASSTTWTEVFVWPYTNQTRLPWKRETFGRSGIYMNNGSPYVRGLGFSSTDTVIPMLSNSVFPTSGTVIVDDEQITYGSKSNNYTPVYPLVVGTSEFRKNDEVFTGYEIILNTADGVHADDYYTGMALVVYDGFGTNPRAFEISDYDAIAPEQWVPTGTYTAPDTWQDHIGEVGYGSWVASNKRRVFVTVDPAGIVGTGKRVRITSCLRGLSRASNGTTAATHGTANISFYTGLTTKCDWVDFYSQDRDNSVEDGLREVVCRSGSYPIFNNLVENPVLSGVWDSVMVGDAYNPIFEGEIASLPSEASVGVVFRASSIATSARANGPDVVSGYMITVHKASGNYFLEFYKSTSSVWSLQEAVPLWFVPQGTMRISIQDTAFSAWIEGLFVHAFRDEGTVVDDDNNYYAGFTSSFSVTIPGRLPELHDFIEDIIIDNRSSGLATIDRFIEGRLVYYCSETNGGIRFYREKYDTGALSIFGYYHSVTSSDKTLTRVRAEGLKTVEAIDFAKLKTYGNVFTVMNSQYSTRILDFRRAAERTIADQYSMATLHEFGMIPHPAIEVGDMFHITPRTTELNIDVTGLAIAMAINEGGLVFEETIQGYEYTGPVDHQYYDGSTGYALL